jgi:hypothetical protein
MKKIILFATVLFAMAACSKDEIGGTATESTAGKWYVTMDAVDEKGNPIDGGEDYFGLEGPIILLTYNTADNNPEEMWVDDLGQFNVGAMYNKPYPSYCIKAKVKVKSDLTFESTDAPNFGDGWNDFVAMPVTIDGKILKGAGHQKNGSAADSIVFFVSYKGDPWYPDDGYAKYKVSGIRYSGLEEND